MNGSTISAIVILLSSVFVIPLDERPPPIRVGVLHSNSNLISRLEQSMIDAVTMAVDEINSRGGLLNGRRLELVIEDAASNGSTFSQKAEKLILQDNVTCIFGCWSSESRHSVRQVMEKHRKLLWYPIPYEGRESSAYVFYSGATPNQQMMPAVEWCRQEFGTRFFLVGSDSPASRTINETIRQRLGDYGEIPTGEEYLAFDNQNCEEIVSRIISSKPHVVLSSISGFSNQVFFAALDAAQKSGESIPVLSFRIAEHEVLEIGPELTAGHYCSRTYFQSLDTIANELFVRNFKRRFGEGRVTDDRVEAAYNQVYLFAKAVDLAESTEVNAISEASRGLIYSAPGGLIRIDPRNQHTWKVAHIGRIRPDGQFTIVWSSEAPIPPRPYMPATFLNTANRFGTLMFTSLSTMIDLEAAKMLQDGGATLLLEIANVRGFLSEARTGFRNALTLIHPNSRSEFEEAWVALERRVAMLSERTEEMTEPQRMSFEQFKTARDAFAENASEMFRAIYPDSRASSEVLP